VLCILLFISFASAADKEGATVGLVLIPFFYIPFTFVYLFFPPSHIEASGDSSRGIHFDVALRFTWSV
jgi:hypothetical protein